MPSHIKHRRSKSPSASSSTSASSSSSSSSSPTRGVYIPLHKRSPPSSTTSLSDSSSSSRGTSPTKSQHRRGPQPSAPCPSPASADHPRIYTRGHLLSLRPFAAVGLKESMRATCPEVVMNRRMRKSIEFNENQARGAEKRERILQMQLQLQQHQEQGDSEEDSQNSIATSLSSILPVKSAVSTTPSSEYRSRPTGRGRLGLRPEAWRGILATGPAMLVAA